MKIINVIPKTELKIKGIKGFLRNKVTWYGTGAKVDIPKRYLGEDVYIIILENEVERKNTAIRRRVKTNKRSSSKSS